MYYMREEALKTVEELNESLFHGSEFYCPFEFKSYGWNNSVVEFLGIPIWSDEEDDREYIKETEELEPLRDYLIREAINLSEDIARKAKILKKLKK